MMLIEEQVLIQEQVDKVVNFFLYGDPESLKPKKHASHCKPTKFRQWNLPLIWNLEFYYIVDIVEHHPIFPLTAMVVEINSPS